MSKRADMKRTSPELRAVDAQMPTMRSAAIAVPEKGGRMVAASGLRGFQQIRAAAILPFPVRAGRLEDLRISISGPIRQPKTWGYKPGRPATPDACLDPSVITLAKECLHDLHGSY
jgi:hypothetical protein